MPKAVICNACEKDYDTARGLRKHHKKYPSHKENANNEKPLQAVAAVSNFLDVSSTHRAARLKELLKHLTTDEFSKIVLPSVAKHVPTSAYLLSKSQHADLEGQVSESRLRSELEVILSMVAGTYPHSLLYSLKQPPISTLLSSSHNYIALPRKYNGKPTNKEWLNFIDDLNLPVNCQQSTLPGLNVCTGQPEISQTQQKGQLIESILSHNNGELFKHILMSIVLKQNFSHFVKFAAGLVSNFNIGQLKYQNIVRNELGKELETVFGVNIMVPKDDMCEKLKEDKQSLQEKLLLDFSEHNGVLAGHTNVKKTVEWLLSKDSMKKTILAPNGKLILYHYIDAFPWMQWSKFFNGETAIRIKLVEPHNLLSSIVTLCSWLGPDDYNHVSNLGKDTLQQLSSMKTVYHPNLKKDIEICVRGVADGCQRRSITGSSSASSTYPIPESPEHQKQLGDMSIICNQPIWREQMTERAEEDYATWLGKRVDNTENR